MADNFDYTPGSGETGGADDISGVKYPRVKLIHGADGVNDGDVATTNPLPVDLPAATISTLTPPAAITGFATSTKQSDKSQITQVCDGAGNVIGATSNALDINIKSGNPTTITATQSTAANLKVEATIAAAQSIGAVCSNAGTFVTQSTCIGSVADDATTPGAPQMIGGMAVETDGTDPTSVSAEGDVAICRTDRNRRLLVNIAHPNSGSANTTETSAQTDKELIAAPAAGLCIYITDILISNGATAGYVILEEDTASAKTVKVPKMYLGINGGVSHSVRNPIRCTAAKNFGFTSNTVTTHSILVNYFIAP